LGKAGKSHSMAACDQDQIVSDTSLSLILVWLGKLSYSKTIRAKELYPHRHNQSWYATNNSAVLSKTSHIRSQYREVIFEHAGILTPFIEQ